MIIFTTAAGDYKYDPGICSDDDAWFKVHGIVTQPHLYDFLVVMDSNNQKHVLATRHIIAGRVVNED